MSTFKSRSLLAAVATVPLLSLLAIVACSSAPGETTASSEAALIKDHCPIGQAPICRVEAGKEVCTCGYAPETCVLEPSVSANPGGSTYFNDFNAAWAVVTVTGSCPNLRGNGGTWEPIHGGYVPGDNVALNGTCALAFPGNPSCCTYVWWPDTTAMQDPTALCTSNTESYAPIVQGGYTNCPEGDAGCGGGAKCDYCLGGI